MMQQSADTTASSKMLQDVIAGLSRPQKTLSSKYFYDNRGSELFEEITKLEEYYPTRVEMKILKHHMPQIKRRVGPRAALLELGSGSSKKTRMLLDNLPQPAAYIPIDISKDFLASIAKNLESEYPNLLIKPLAADYTSSFSLPQLDVPFNRLVAFYPGSTIGNFRPSEAGVFLHQIADIIGSSGGLLIGVDLKKDKQILENAYNDSKGITAAFNKNILRRLNRELGANFTLEAFRHQAIYNENEGRIEMHLVSLESQQVQVGNEVFNFQQGESIHTENSYKYTVGEFQTLVEDRYKPEQVWKDEDNLFSLHYLSVK